MNNSGEPAAWHFQRRRMFVNKTNHLQPDRRRCFYLAILFGFVFEQVFAIVVSSL
ncbi:hypothetical protein [Erythrobacter sp. HI0063]|uniref:hypothetical protein n=1 Tax=Erythrobacter sp. HI0063 TaxID=1822240 RepID=UPI000A90B0E2|nr:hypothetical protein [Erythrobacter sp. HI0063]